MKVRQPLNKVFVASADSETRELLQETVDIIAEELNVKKVEIDADETELVTRSVKADFKSLGPKLGKNMKEVAAIISAFDEIQLNSILAGENVSITLSSGDTFEITPEDVLIHRDEKPGICVSTEKEITVALDTVLTDELKEEGLAREFVSRIQNMRKKIGFEVSDRIDIFYCSEDADLKDAISRFRDYICHETLTIQLSAEETIDPKKGKNMDVEGIDITVYLEKV